MLSKKLEEKIEKTDVLTRGDFDKIKEVDILTDFDKTMIKEQSAYVQIFSYINYLFKQHSYRDLKNVGIEILHYGISKDIKNFFSLFKGCPIEVIDKSTNELRQKDEWFNFIDGLNPEKIGIVSQNNKRFIEKYLNKIKLPYKIKVKRANIPEIKNGIYTGNAKIYVNNNNLVNFVKGKDYICGRYEKKILENHGDLNFEKVASGLYICYKRKVFLGWTKKKQLELVK